MDEMEMNHNEIDMAMWKDLQEYAPPKNLSGQNEVSGAIKPKAASGEMQGQGAYHSTQSLQAEVKEEPDTPFWRKIRWAPASDKHAWHEFNVVDISEILETTLRGSVDKRLMTMFKIIIIYAAGKFRYDEREKKKEKSY